MLAITRQVAKVLRPGKTLEAEQIVLSALGGYDGPEDSEDRRSLISELIQIYLLAEPVIWQNVERFCEERERIWPDAFSKLQTGMMFFWSQDDYERAIPKLREAIELGRSQNEEYDSMIVYQSLSTLGHAFLKLGRQSEAIEVLGEIEAMIPGKIVVGDETGFLEVMLEQNLALDRIAKLASILAPHSREAAFRERLAQVAKQAASRA